LTASASASAGVAENASSARERLLLRLDNMPFDTHQTVNADQQAAWQDEYLTWATSVLERREAAFGPEARYELHSNMSVDVAGAMLPAVYDAARSFISSTSRSPVSNTVTNALGTAGEFTNTYDPAVIGGIAGGLAVYAVDRTLLGAMDRLSWLANMPSLKPVDIDALIPEPCTVQLRLSNRGGVTYKRFERVATDAEPRVATHDASPNTSLAALRRTSAERREAVGAWQSVLNGRSGASLVHPTFTGLTNMGRRAWLPESALFDTGQLLGASALASGTAAAASRLALGIARSLPWVAQTHVDDLLGGTQRVNLFVSTRRDADARAAGFASIVSLPRYLIPLARETVSLGLHAIPIPFLHRSWKDLGAQGLDMTRHAFSNACASVFSVSVGSMVAQLARNGSLTALPGEAHNSPAALLQQFTQSAASDHIWEVFKANLSAVEHKLGNSLDQLRDMRVSHFRMVRVSAGGEVKQALNRLELDKLSVPMHAALVDLSRELDVRDVAGAETLRQARKRLQSAAGSDVDILGAERLPLLDATAKMLRAGSSIEALERVRRAPGGTPGD
jgi:hypothetical protein